MISQDLEKESSKVFIHYLLQNRIISPRKGHNLMINEQKKITQEEVARILLNAQINRLKKEEHLTFKLPLILPEQSVNDYLQYLLISKEQVNVRNLRVSVLRQAIQAVIDHRHLLDILDPLSFMHIT